MAKIQFPPYTLQWLGLATGLTLLGLALIVTMTTRQEIPVQQVHPPLTIQGKHVPFTAPPKRLTVSSAREVWDYYEKISFTMANLEAGHVDVPRIYLTNIINTWAKDETVTFKKSLFYRTMLPLILRVNELIANERHRLSELLTKKKESSLTPPEMQWLRELAVEYRVLNRSYRGRVTDQHLETLLRRVDIIPTSMALGQAAYESAYATSRFAMEGNALFGQWRWGSGLLPAEQRGGLGDYRIADFATPLDSMAAFAKNLNTNRAYMGFRMMRSDLRNREEPLDGYTLAAGLVNYSEKGEAYVETLRQIISQNNLGLLDNVKLGSGQPISLSPTWSDEEG